MNKHTPRGTLDQSSWNPQVARGWAFVIWLVMLLVPLAVFALILSWPRPELDPSMTTGRTVRMFVVMAMTATLVITAVYFHRRQFRIHWREGVVEPRAYLRASVVLWSGIAVSVIVALVGCVLDGSWIPNLIIAGMMFMVLTATWPTGRAMVHRRSRNEEDDDEDVLHLPEQDDSSR